MVLFRKIEKLRDGSLLGLEYGSLNGILMAFLGNLICSEDGSLLVA
jgi:hypothetical protein